MSNVIKRRHTVQYSQIHNNPLQNDLEDLRSIGLLSYLMSLPADWTIYKTHLHNKFSRKNADAAWKELAEKNYAVGFAAYVNGKKQHFYNISDIPFTSEEFGEFVRETVNELHEQGFIVKSLVSMKFGGLGITEKMTNVLKVQQSEPTTNSTNVPRVQYSEYCTDGAYTKEIYTNEILTKNNINNDDDKRASSANCNDESITLIINELKEHTKDLLTKRSFDAVLRKVMDKYQQGQIEKSFRDYLVSSLHTKIEELELRRIKDNAKQEMLQNKPSMASGTTRGIQFYNWLEN